MFASIIRLAAVATLAASFAAPGAAQNVDNGVRRVKSAYSMSESVARIKADIAAKGILFFNEVDQSALAAKAGITLRPSTLLEFGNPPLGTQFITANPDAGLDWPVRLLLTQDDAGTVWAVYTDFTWTAKRHQIITRNEQFAMANKVVGSITSAIADPR
jgi:uncharacterized protein (DUF302 family)